MLSEAGITGTSDEDVVNKWSHPCRTVITREERLGLRHERTKGQ